MKLSQWNIATGSAKKRPNIARWDSRDELFFTTEHQISCLKNDVVYYSTLPTQASAFISKSSTPIAALSTPKGVYAFTHGNTKLEFWSSPEIPSETLCNLPSPAIDLEFCTSCVYGSCEDGKSFVSIGDTVEIIPSIVEGCTILKTIVLENSSVSVGTKRKSKMDSFKLYQVVEANDGIVLIVHELIAEDTTIQVTRSDTLVLHQKYDQLEIIGFHHDQLGFCYTRESLRYFGSLSLTSSRISSLPVPPGARSVVLMGQLLVVLQGDSLIFVDSLRGGIIEEKLLPSACCGDREQESIEMVAKERRLAIMYGHDVVQVATIQLSSTTGTNLASLLSSSLPTSISALHAWQLVPASDRAVDDSITILLGAYQQIVKQKILKDGFLLQAFESALKCHGDLHDDYENPQEPNPKKRSKTLLNGVHHNGTNGKSTLGHIEIPHSLIECATDIVVKLLCIDKLEHSESARLLKRLVRTKKVLARKNFTSLRNLLYALRRSTEYNSLDLVMDMLTYCPDVSELQLVVSLRYVICFATDEDILLNAKNTGEPERMGGKIEGKSTMNIVRTSLGRFLLQILSYSSCNDNLLRLALADVLSTAEMGITSNLLVDILESQSDSKIKGRATQWLSNICDCLKRQSHHSLSIDTMKRRINSYTKNSQGTIALKGVLDSLLDTNDGVKNSDSMWAGKLQPYQIERLIF